MAAHIGKLFGAVLLLAYCCSMLAFMPGCTVGPDFVPPEVAMPEEYAQSPVEGEPVESEQLSAWWQMLGDPLLSELIERALKSAPDIRAAMGRIDEAKWQLAYVTGEEMPRVDKAADLRYGRDSKHSGLGDTVITDIPNVRVKDTEHMFTGVIAQWEVDLFGRIRRMIESSVADYDASVFDYRGVRVALCAEIAAAYINVRSLEQRIKIAEANIDIQDRSLKIVRNRYQAGAAPSLEVSQAEANLARSASTLSPLQRDLVCSLNRLSVLIGEYPGSLDKTIADTTARFTVRKAFPGPLPAELLRRRPDIRQAELLLAAQTAQVGVATAELYPRFILFGRVGAETIEASQAFDSGSVTYSIGPSIRWRLFDRNRVRSAIAVENARVNQALVRYEQTVLIAVEEVENAYVSYHRQAERNDYLAEAVTAYRSTVALAIERYSQGATDFQNVLDAQRSLLAVEDQLAESDAILTKELVFLYRSLGGGWDWEPASGEQQL